MALPQETAIKISLEAYENCIKMIKIWVENDPNPKRDKANQLVVATRQFSIVIQTGLLQAAINNGHISDDEISFLSTVSQTYPGVLEYMRGKKGELDWKKIDELSDSEAVELCNDIYDYCSDVARVFATNYGSIAKSRGNEAREFLNLVKFIFEVFTSCDTPSVEKCISKKAVQTLFLDLWEKVEPAQKATDTKPTQVSGTGTSKTISVSEILGDIFGKKTPSARGANLSPKLLNKDSAKMLNYAKNKRDYIQVVVMVFVETAKARSTGTAFLISEDGYAVTNAHVVEGAKKITARISDGVSKPTYVEAKVVKSDTLHDAAIIKLAGSGYKYCEVDDSFVEPVLGEDVAIFGYPFGISMTENLDMLSISFTRGYVSSNQQLFGQRTTFLDINAYPGNSGSPVVNLATGEVIGILSGAFKDNVRMIQIKYMIDLLK